MRVFLFVLPWIIQPPKVEVLEKQQYQAMVEMGILLLMSELLRNMRKVISEEQKILMSNQRLLSPK